MINIPYGLLQLFNILLVLIHSLIYDQFGVSKSNVFVHSGLSFDKFHVFFGVWKRTIGLQRVFLVQFIELHIFPILFDQLFIGAFLLQTSLQLL